MRTIDSLPDGVPKEFDEQLHPGRRYDQPADGLADASLTVAERRDNAEWMKRNEGKDFGREL